MSTFRDFVAAMSAFQVPLMMSYAIIFRGNGSETRIKKRKVVIIITIRDAIHIENIFNHLEV